eukprot:TRINITY_DN17755_c0_g1_i1.p1 TRINITY_DN17755_c0_g1~~TRINITY_DN17755_c0_g1_i1.p1  ORF type:complete len:225 (+),score=48.28 TRINITY_DN17755_c0_g1_i1:39-713(+)
MPDRRRHECLHCGEPVAAEEYENHLRMKGWDTVADQLFKPVGTGTLSDDDIAARQALLLGKVPRDDDVAAYVPRLLTNQLRRALYLTEGAEDPPLLRPQPLVHQPPEWIFAAETAALGRYHAIQGAAEGAWCCYAAERRGGDLGASDCEAAQALDLSPGALCPPTGADTDLIATVAGAADAVRDALAAGEDAAAVVRSRLGAGAVDDVVPLPPALPVLDTVVLS